MLNDVMYSSGIGGYVLVLCKLLLLWFCLDSVELGCRGMVAWSLFSSFVNCVCGCRLLMWCGSS